MRKFYASLMIILLLVTGCSLKEEPEEPDYLTLVKNAVNDSFTLEETTDNSLSILGTDIDRQNYVKKLFACFNCTAVSLGENNKYTVTLEYPNLEELAAIAVNDNEGFINDLKNLSSLGSSEEEQIAYVFNYLGNCVTKVSKKSDSISVIAQINDDSVILEDDSFLVNYCSEFVENLPAQLVGYAVNDIPLSLNVGVENVNKTELTVGKGTLLNYYYGDKSYKLFITPTMLLKDTEAVEKIKDINSANADFNAGNNSVFYLEYTVCNLEDEDVTLEDPFKLIDSDNNVNTYSGFKFVGINSTQKVLSGETKVITAVYIGNGDNLSLGWYDSINKLFIAVE